MAKIGNKNAIKHGAFAEAVLLPQENSEEFQNHLAALYEEWSPEGAAEKDKVHSIAMNMWRKLRFRRYLQNKFAEIVKTEKLFRDAVKNDFRELVAFINDSEIELDCAVIETLIDKLNKARADCIKKKFPREFYKDDEAWRSAVIDYVAACLKENMHHPNRRPADYNEFADEVLAEREQAFEERIDAKVDRDIKQLVQIQAMKAIGAGKRRVPIAAEPLELSATTEQPEESVSPKPQTEENSKLN